MRWPSGLRRQTKEISLFDKLVIWSLRGRGFESHSHHVFVLRVITAWQCFILVLYHVRNSTLPAMFTSLVSIIKTQSGEATPWTHLSLAAVTSGWILVQLSYGPLGPRCILCFAWLIGSSCWSIYHAHAATRFSGYLIWSWTWRHDLLSDGEKCTPPACPDKRCRAINLNLNLKWL